MLALRIILLFFWLLVIGCSGSNSPSVREELSGNKSEKPIVRVVAPNVAQMKLNRIASCYASLCHGGEGQSVHALNADRPCSRNEAILWARFDPHVHAYECLKSSYSKQMIKKLRDPIPAEKNSRCLTCHAPQLISLVEGGKGSGSHLQFAKTECLMCHGAQQEWIDGHVDWHDLTLSKKKAKFAKFGMRMLSDSADRIQVCMECHVGAPANKKSKDPSLHFRKDVDHDLIAAGHPRLDFYYQPFQEAITPHWNHEADTRKREDQIAVWAVSQWYGMKARVQLLHSRFEQSEELKTWPEFTEISCFACHKDLAQYAFQAENTNTLKTKNPHQNKIWGNPYRFFFSQTVSHLIIPSIDSKVSVRIEQMNERITKIENAFRIHQLPDIALMEGELKEIVKLFEDSTIDAEIRKFAKSSLSQSAIRNFLNSLEPKEETPIVDWHRMVATLILLKQVGIQYKEAVPDWNEYLRKVERLEAELDFIRDPKIPEENGGGYINNSPQRGVDYDKNLSQFHQLLKEIPPIR